jgi:hypothetical protein
MQATPKAIIQIVIGTSAALGRAFAAAGSQAMKSALPTLFTLYSSR